MKGNRRNREGSVPLRVENASITFTDLNGKLELESVMLCIESHLERGAKRAPHAEHTCNRQVNYHCVAQHFPRSILGPAKLSFLFSELP